MQRQIYEVYAKIVDANGTYSTLSGYPKSFDSRNYNNDIYKTFQRAQGEFYSTFGTMCTRDDRQIQTVFLMSINGDVLISKSIGKLADLPDPDLPLEVEE